MKNKRFANILKCFVMSIAAIGAACTAAPDKQQSYIIEITGNDSTTLSADKLLKFCEERRIPASAVFQWKNHLVLFDKSEKPSEIKEHVSLIYPEASLKLYDKPFYTFDRSMCDKKETAKNWDHVVMTANLVEDAAMQQEYMTYHANQARDWPEVAEGFCRADFQQLLIFRNGRQLMLVISIPAGASLDELNPKTTENNPRVDDWNALMSKYQEGIEGTAPGETWVLLNRVK